MSRLPKVLLGCLLILLLLPGAARADPADEAKALLSEATTVGEEMTALNAQITERWAEVSEIDPAANNATDALPLLAEIDADYAEMSEKAEAMVALTDEMAALDVSEEMKTAAGLMKKYAESWLEFCAFESDVIGKLEILFDPIRMNKLSQAELEALNQEFTDLVPRETELNAQIGETRQAALQYVSDTDFPEDSAGGESPANELSRGTLIAIGIGGLVFNVVFAFLCGYLARRKNRSAVGWAILGFLFPVIALIIVAVLSEKTPEQSEGAATPTPEPPPSAVVAADAPAAEPSAAAQPVMEPAPPPPEYGAGETSTP